MATSNLIQRTLGSSFFESGNGEPDHVSSRGSVYVDRNTGLSYLNRSVASTGSLWRRHFGPLYRGGMCFGKENTTPLINTTTGWVEFNQTLTFVPNGGLTENLSVVQVSPQDYRLRVLVAGTYYIMFTATTLFTAGNTNNLSLGISINTATPDNSSFRRKMSNTAFTSNSYELAVVKTLAANDTISVAFNNGGQNLLLLNAAIYVYQF